MHHNKNKRLLLLDDGENNQNPNFIKRRKDAKNTEEPSTMIFFYMHLLVLPDNFNYSHLVIITIPSLLTFIIN